jgi:hypothetical protein
MDEMKVNSKKHLQTMHIAVKDGGLPQLVKTASEMREHAGKCRQRTRTHWRVSRTSTRSVSLDLFASRRESLVRDAVHIWCAVAGCSRCEEDLTAQSSCQQH